MATEVVVDWVTDANTCFLLGAGCSKCAGKPLITELTAEVENALSEDAKAILSDLKGTCGRCATVEDLMSHLLQLGKLLSSRRTPDEGLWTPDKIEEEIGGIQEAIVEAIGEDWMSCAVHADFLRRLAIRSARRPCDIFCLNYDTVIEATLESVKLPYTDGFCGAENAYFDPALLEQQRGRGPHFRLHKLHGSINWIRDENEVVRRRSPYSIEDHRRLVVYPAEQKYIETQYGVYETLLSAFRKRLRSSLANNKLVVLGYSFSDEHINVAIEDSVRAEGSDLTVHAFLGPESDLGAQVDRLAELAERCDDRFNVLIGGHGRIGPALTDDEAADLLALDLWKFENIVQMLTGA